MVASKSQLTKLEVISNIGIVFGVVHVDQRFCTNSSLYPYKS
jgi:hypothetical protein